MMMVTRNSISLDKMFPKRKNGDAWWHNIAIKEVEIKLMVRKCGKLSYDDEVSNFLIQVYLSEEQAARANKLENMYKPVHGVP